MDETGSSLKKKLFSVLVLNFPPMKKFLSILLLATLSFEGVFAEDTIDLPDLMSYERYQQNVEAYCKPTQSNLWVDWEKDSLIKIEQVKYADISKSTGDESYKNYLKTIKADSSFIDATALTNGPTFLEKASYVYRETMGAVYACAVMNAKVRIIDNLLKKIPTTQSNIKQKLTNQLTYTRKSMGTQGCREVANTSELSFKKSLLDNTTYQYCNYRHYLNYLENASKQSLNDYYKSKGATGSGQSILRDTDSGAKEIMKSTTKISQEVAHSREVFPQAMVAFSEFEKTYASHILLEFILQDYMNLRDSLKKLLNPIGQVIYKASNAQSPGK